MQRTGCFAVCLCLKYMVQWVMDMLIAWNLTVKTAGHDGLRGFLRHVLTHSSFVAMNWEIMRLSIILWIKRDIVFQYNKIINALRQKKMSFSLRIIERLIPCVTMTVSYCQHSVNPHPCLPLPHKETGVRDNLWFTMQEMESRRFDHWFFWC